MSTYSTREGQSIFDLSLQLYGTEDRVVEIFMSNPELLSLNDNIKAGTIIEFTEEQNETRQYVLDSKIDIATGDTNIETGKGFDEGFSFGFN